MDRINEKKVEAKCCAAFNAQEREGKEVGCKRAEVAKEACILGGLLEEKYI